MKTLEGKVALVTGSSRGIGAAIAKLFAQEGGLVVLNGRDQAALSAAQAEIEQQGGRAMSVVADVTKFEEVEAMRRRIEGTFGLVEILVANAGGNFVLPGPLEEMSEEGWRATIDANLTATFLTIKSFLPGMKSRGKGSIVTISSAAERRPTAQSPMAYTAAKAGINALTQGVATQAGPYGIRVNCIAPETILTERNQTQIPDAVKESMVKMHPLRRLGTPDDVARAALFLVSPDSAWITGITVDVAGGSVLA